MSRERCEAELREIQQRPDVQAGTAPAWLVALGQADWLAEMEYYAESTMDSSAAMR